MTDEVRLGNVMVDCGDEQALQSFYGQLLNWETATLFGRPAVRSAEGVVFLFCQEEDYVPPVWPEKGPGRALLWQLFRELDPGDRHREGRLRCSGL